MLVEKFRMEIKNNKLNKGEEKKLTQAKHSLHALELYKEGKTKVGIQKKTPSRITMVGAFHANPSDTTSKFFLLEYLKFCGSPSK